MFQKVHKEQSVAFRGDDKPTSKYNPLGPNDQESRFVRCKFCLSINDTLKRPKGDGWGGNISKVDTGASATTLYYGVVTGSGCWFCGSSEYY